MEIKGTYNSATVFTDNIGQNCIDQIKTLVNCQAFADAKIKIMPDCHAGVGCVVGYTQTIQNKIVPNLVGVDGSCGMAYVKIPKVDLRMLDKIIRRYIPAGTATHDSKFFPNNLKKKVELMLDSLNAVIGNTDAIRRILNSIGTLGGGNHFIEVGKSMTTGEWFLIVHSGSRNLGLQVCKYWQNMASKNLAANKYDVGNVIEQLKKEGRESEIESAIKMLKDKNRDIPKNLAYLQGVDMENYLHDMSIVDNYAALNRQTLIEIILGKLGVKMHRMKIFTTKHNYIDQSVKILRKGAISAQADEEVLIPLNMRDGSLICVGKGNPDWNFSAPHGAGRLMSSTQAKESISLDGFVKSMEGIFSSSVNESTIDESPMAYKDAAEIESLIVDTVEIRDRLTPLYNFKAGS